MAFYGWFSQRRVTAFGARRRRRVEAWRLSLLHRYARPPGDLVEVGPGEGSLADGAIAAGWGYRCVEASPVLAARLRRRGLAVTEAWVPPLPGADGSSDVVYADQVLEHMPGVDAARRFVAETHRVLRPQGVAFIVVPNYLKEGAFFWDVDYTHNFVTTARRMLAVAARRRLSHRAHGPEHRGGHRDRARGACRERVARQPARSGRALSLHAHGGSTVPSAQEPLRDIDVRSA